MNSEDMVWAAKFAVVGGGVMGHASVPLGMVWGPLAIILGGACLFLVICAVILFSHAMAYENSRMKVDGHCAYNRHNRRAVTRRDRAWPVEIQSP